MEYGPDIPLLASDDRETFESPPLKALLGQVRFPPILRIGRVDELAPFQEAIRGDFPEFLPEQQFSITLGPAGPQGASASQAYRFRTADQTWSAVLTPDALTLEADVSERYTSYDEFQGYFAQVWDAVLEYFGPTRVLRQGLRYVDHIEGAGDAGEWERYINKDLLGPLIGAFGPGVAQSVSELSFPRPDGVLVFKHGMLPAGPSATMGYLLDFDYFNEEPSDDVSVETLANRFDAFHHLLYSFFRWCVTEEALEEFRRGR